MRTKWSLFLPGNCVKYWAKYDNHWEWGHRELLDEYQLWWCNVEESFCRVIKMPWSTTHCHRLNQDDQQECRNKMIFPCSVNAETGDQPTQDVLSSQRCEAEEDSVVVLDSRYYSFTQRTIMESHFSTVVVKFCKSWCNRKKKGKRLQNTSWLFFGSNSTEANEKSVLILDEETEDGVEIEILDR